MDIRTIETRTHGRYLVSSRPQASLLLVGFHGYRENAQLHFEVLERVVGDRPICLVSVQGTHRFYDKGGRIAASWMTSEDRELAITDNLAYVSAVVAEVARECQTSARLVYAGFSQGVAMAYRAAAFVPHRCDGLIVLAGDVPPDVIPVSSRLPRTLLGRGTRDEYYTAEKAALDRSVLEKANVELVEHIFEGGHEWHESFVSRAGGFLDERISS